MHCVVTSPPYWGLRDYQTPSLVWGGETGCSHSWRRASYQRRSSDSGKSEKQGSNVGANNRDVPVRYSTCARCGAWRGHLGLEPTPDLYVQHLVEIFREVRRVLRDDGTVWLNMGDSYAGSGVNDGVTSPGLSKAAQRGDVKRRRPRSSRADGVVKAGSPRFRDGTATPPGLKPKDLVGIPWRVAFALQADGWYLRSDVIWSKPNSMPESVTDRPTRSHEYVFLLSKMERYYYDADAIRELHSSNFGRPLMLWSERPNNGAESMKSYPPGNTTMGFHENGRNRRSVWSIPTQPYPAAHFATFPEALVERCIKAMTSEKGCCVLCGVPWVRVVAKTPMVIRRSTRTHSLGRTRSSGIVLKLNQLKHMGWRPSCVCGKLNPVPCVVLDQFIGSGTVAVVAERLGRSWIGIDLSDKYASLAWTRIKLARRGKRVSKDEVQDCQYLNQSLLFGG